MARSSRPKQSAGWQCTACYYANWYETAFRDFLQNLFAGKTFGEAYRSYPNGNNPAKIVDLYYPHQSRYKMHIGSEQYGTDTAYNNALIGDESKMLLDLFKKGWLMGERVFTAFYPTIKSNFHG